MESESNKNPASETDAAACAPAGEAARTARAAERLACAIVDEARVSLGMAFRYLDAALWRMPTVPLRLAAPVATDGARLGIDAVRVIARFRANPDAVARDVLHAVLHCLLRHPFAAPRARADVWSCACDIAVESMALDLCAGRFACEEDARTAPLLESCTRDLGVLTPAKLYRAGAGLGEAVERPAWAGLFAGFAATGSAVAADATPSAQRTDASGEHAGDAGAGACRPCARDSHELWRPARAEARVGASVRAAARKESAQAARRASDEASGKRSAAEQGKRRSAAEGNAPANATTPASASANAAGAPSASAAPASENQPSADGASRSANGEPAPSGQRREKSPAVPGPSAAAERDERPEAPGRAAAWAARQPAFDAARSFEPQASAVDPAGLSRSWEQVARTVAAGRAAGVRGQGRRGGAFEQNLELACRTRTDYADFLRRFATVAEDQRLSPDEFDYVYYAYGLRRYGNLPLIEPLEYQERRRVREFVIAIDTSGSTQGDLVRAFVTRTYEILHAHEQFGDVVNVHLVQADACVQSDTVVHRIDELDRIARTITVRGGGGTDFRPVFAYVEQLRAQGVFRNLQGLVYFTDGWGTFPDRPPDYDTAFVFVENDGAARRVPPWAMRVVMDEDQVRDLGRGTADDANGSRLVRAGGKEGA